MRGMGLRSDIRLSPTRGGAAAPLPPLNPPDLLPIMWMDPSDAATLFEDTTAVDAAEIGDPVARFNDKSGNGYHWNNITLANRPIYTAAGYLTFDGVNDMLNPLVAMTLPATFEVHMGIENTTADTSFMLQHGTGGAFSGVAVSGSGSTPSTGGAATHTVNGTTVSPNTRGALHTAIGSGPKVVQITGIPNTSQGNLIFGGQAGFEFGGRLYGYLVTPALTADQRTQVRTYLGAKMGLTL